LAASAVVGLLLASMAYIVVPLYRTMTAREHAAYPIVATLGDTQNAVWAPAQTAAFSGAHLVAGHRMHLLSCMAEVTYHSGAHVVLQGPCDYRIDGDNSGSVQEGTLVARVPASAVGFTVSTPNSTLVDLGTEFGVVVEKSGA